MILILVYKKGRLRVWEPLAVYIEHCRSPCKLHLYYKGELLGEVKRKISLMDFGTPLRCCGDLFLTPPEPAGLDESGTYHFYCND